MRSTICFICGLIFAGMISIPAFAINLDQGFDQGKLPANQITPDCSQWSKNLSCTQKNQQDVDNVVDQLSGGGSGSNYWSFSPGNIGITTTNNVGIGSTSPTVSLDVVGAGHFTGNIVSGQGTQATPSISPGLAGNGIYLQSASSGGQLGLVANGNQVVIDHNGNVAIGTSSTASELLDVNQSQNATSQIRVANTSAATSALPNFEADNGTYNVTLSMPGTGYTPVIGINPNIAILLASGPGMTFEDNNASGFFNFNGQSGTLLATLTNLPGLGIGTAAPGGTLDVGTGTICLNHVCDSTWPSGGSPSGWTLGASNVGISTTNNVGIGTNITGSAGLSVMNGNVGIGTWVPNNKFMVIGNASIGYVAGPANTAPSNGMIVNGNVGIGTFNPQTTLDVFSLANNSPIINIPNGDIFSASGTKAIRLNNSGNFLEVNAQIGFGTNPGTTGADTDIQRASAGKIYVGNGSTGDTSGALILTNIGVGTPNPINSLEVGSGVHPSLVAGGTSVEIGTTACASYLCAGNASTNQFQVASTGILTSTTQSGTNSVGANYNVGGSMVVNNQGNGSNPLFSVSDGGSYNPITVSGDNVGIGTAATTTGGTLTIGGKCVGITGSSCYVNGVQSVCTSGVCAGCVTMVTC